MNIKNYIRIIDNELMELLGEKPIYFIHAQFRDTVNGEMRLFEKHIKVNNKNNKNLQNYFVEELNKFIEEKESNYIYKFVPYENAVYNFALKRKQYKSWNAKIFYDEEEKQTHKYYLRLAQEKYLKKEREIYGNII